MGMVKMETRSADLSNITKYIHPQEPEVTQRLDSNLISDEYCNQMMENYRLFQLETELPDYIAKCLEVNEVQLPQIHKIAKEIAEKLDMDLPTIFVFESYYFNTSAEGLDQPWIQISTKTLENFEEDELRFVIAREMAHIKLGHMKWKVLCEEFAKNIELASQVITVPGLAVTSQQAFDIYADRFKLIAANWNRISEYSADRCALAICDWNIKAAISAILKQILNSSVLAKNVNLSSFLKQTDAIMSFTTNAAKFTRMDEAMPYGPFRLKELIAFASLENLKCES